MFDVAVNQAEIYLQRKFKNPLEIIDQDGKLLDYVYSETMDESLSAFKKSAKMEPFIKEFGNKFTFYDKNGSLNELG